ncbi:SH3 domain-containing protein [Pyxidicoccus sp. 3LFB2]
MSTLLLGLMLALAGEAGGAEPRLYVLGTSVGLRAEACEEAPVLKQVPFGTECIAQGAGQGEWQAVRCGDAEGHALAALLGPRKPSLEKLKAEARNPRRTLEQREEIALRASMLAPEDAALRKELGALFFVRHLDAVASLKTPPMRRTFSFTCTVNDAARCLSSHSSSLVSGARVRVQTKKDLFVIALGTGEALTVYRGRFQLDNKRFAQTGKVPVKGELLDEVHQPLNGVLGQALFADSQPSEYSERWPPLGQYSLDLESLALLSALPTEWALLTLDTDDGVPRTFWDPCGEELYVLVFRQDIHGRVLMTVTGPGGLRQSWWLAVVSKRENDLDLTLVDLDSGKRTQEIFKLPAPNADIAYLGKTPYTRKLKYYPSVDPGPCREGGP